MIREALSFLSGIFTSMLENDIINHLQKKENAKLLEKHELETIISIDNRLKGALEKEEIKDWIFKEEANIVQNGCLFNESDKKEFVDNFFKNASQYSVMYSKEAGQLLYDYLDQTNAIANEIISPEGKLIIHTVRCEGQRNTDRVIDVISSKIEELKPSTPLQQPEDKKVICSGYGIKKGLCTNFVDQNSSEYCIECLGSQYYDRILNLYVIQKYLTTRKKGYFIAEQKSGIIKSKAIVFPFYSNTYNATDDAVIQLSSRINSVDDLSSYQYIHIITNSQLSLIQKRMFVHSNIEIYTEEDILNNIMDLESYLYDLATQYTDSDLSKHYIELYDEHSNDLLENTVSDFINSPIDNAFLILGDYGCGKTSFLMNLSYKLAQNYLAKQSEYIPLLIPLKDYSKAIDLNNLFLSFFDKYNMLNTSTKAFHLLLQHKKFIILFDGFDEVAKKVNHEIKLEIFNEICKCCLGETKIIVTCRPNYFQDKKEYRNLIENSRIQFEPYTSIDINFKETYIQPLNAKQIKDYIKSYEKDLAAEGLTVQSVEDLIKNTHDLTDLSKRPFMLNIIVSTLPKLVEEFTDETQAKGSFINTAVLYKKYTGLWLDREILKGKTLISKEDKLHFCKYIAYKMYKENKATLHFSEFPEEIRHYFSHLTNITEIDYFSHDIQSCSFMSSDGSGEFKFIHKSFMEFFVASIVAESLLKANEFNTETIKKALALKDISSEVALFISDILRENPMQHQKIIFNLKSHISNADNATKENIISILSKSSQNMGDMILDGGNYSGCDFSNCSISNVTIKNADFSNASFYHSHIENVKFINCQFEQTYFQKATIVHVDFSEQFLTFSNMSFCRIENCKFVSSSLADVQMISSTVQKNNFRDCDMSGLNSEGTIFKNNYNYEYSCGAPYEMK